MFSLQFNANKLQILSLDGTQVGKISKQWSGLARELFTDADNFGISFPMNLDVRMKAVMLGACILIVIPPKNVATFDDFSMFSINVFFFPFRI